MYDGLDIDGDLLVRRRRSGAPRLPTEEQVRAPVHIAVVSWNALTGDATWPRRLHWLVVVSDLARDAGRPAVHRHRLDREDGVGWPKVIASVRAQLDPERAAWVALPTRCVATAYVLHRQGLPVSFGLDGNRAASRAIEVMQDCRRHDALLAISSGTDRERSDEVDGAAVGADVVTEEAQEAQWFPTLDPPSGSRPIDSLIVATDASVDRTLAVSAAVSVNGALALESTAPELSSGEAELNAVSLALERFGPDVTDEICVLSDSVDAVVVARALADNRVPTEGFRGMCDDVLDRFEDAWDRLRCVPRFVHVKGHVGHRLNEAADELATIGRLSGRYPQAHVDRELQQRSEAIASMVRRCAALEVTVPELDFAMQAGMPLMHSVGSAMASTA